MFKRGWNPRFFNKVATRYLYTGTIAGGAGVSASLGISGGYLSEQNRLRRYLTEFSASVVWEAIKGIGGVVSLAAAAWILSIGRTAFPILVENHSITIGIVLGACGSIVLVRLYYERKYHDAPPKQQYDFEQVSRAISFEYKNIETVVYTKSIVLRAKRQGLCSYVDKYRWTGNSDPIISSCVNGQSIHLTQKKNVWQLYQIDFDRQLNKGESVETKLVFTMKEPNHPFTPFISTTIEEPTRFLSLELKIPPKFGVTHVICEIASCMGARVSIHTKTIQLSIDGVAHWEEIPKMHQSYEMKWQLPRENS